MWTNGNPGLYIEILRGGGTCGTVWGLEQKERRGDEANRCCSNERAIYYKELPGAVHLCLWTGSRIVDANCVDSQSTGAGEALKHRFSK